MRAFPGATSGLMLTIPMRGELCVEGEAWLFQKHGLGVRFCHPASGRVVDVHRFYEDVQDAIDAWRILQFAESMGISAITEQVIDDALMRLVRSGALLQTDHQHVYRLA